MTAPMPPETVAAEVTSYSELIAGIEAKRQVLGVKQTDFDELAGFADGLWGKVSGLLQVKQVRVEKLFDALRAAGLRLRLENDPDQDAKMRDRIASKYNPRQANQARNGNHASTISTQVLSRAFGHVLREARKKRWAGKSPEERSEHARNIANARWKQVRKKRKALQRRRVRDRQRAKAEQAGVAA